jgi:hypothetical protein
MHLEQIWGSVQGINIHGSSNFDWNWGVNEKNRRYFGPSEDQLWLGIEGEDSDSG